MSYFFLYFSVFLISAVLGMKYQKHYRKEERVRTLIKLFWILLIIGVPAFLACIRSGIGEDYSNYEEMFKLAEADSNLFFYYFSNIEIGNWFLIKIGYFMFGEVQGVFCLYTIITMVLLVATVLYYVDRIPMFVSIIILYILYYPASYNTLRQVLAASIILFALRFIEKKKLGNFLLCVGIAVMFHSSAFIVIPYYFYFNRGGKYNKLVSKSVFLAYIIFPLFVIFIYTYGAGIPIIGKYFQNYKLSFNMEYWFDIVCRLIIYVPCLMYIKKDIFRDDRNKLYYFLALVDMEYLILSFFFPWAYRLTYYTAFTQIILVGNRLRYTPNFNTRLAKTTYYLGIYSIIFIFLYCLWQRDGIVPYQSIFYS